MNESFLAYVWKSGLLSPDLVTESGEKLAILHPGMENHDSGPDFFNARLRIGDTTWAGNVEIHTAASDWYRHGHQVDPAYDRVILHVVYEADCEVLDSQGIPLPTVVIREHLPAGVFDRYRQMMEARQWIPCLSQLRSDEDSGISLWLPALAVDRLRYKSGDVGLLLNGCRNDWNVAMFIHLAGCFGFKVNSMAFEMLAKSIPLRLLARHHDNLLQLEALLFGQAGMLDRTFKDEYPKELQQHYEFFRAKYNLQPVEVALWKFLRLRPPNFPTLRISQLACFIHQVGAGFFDLIAGESLEQASRFRGIRASAYWENHYVFDKQTRGFPKILGLNGERLLVINGLAPFLFFYGMVKCRPSVCEGVVGHLERMPGEQNHMIDCWKRAGFPADNALQTQALLHLKQSYCEKKRCLECRVGAEILGKECKV